MEEKTYVTPKKFENMFGFYIGVLHSKENLCRIPNQLILDRVMDGYVLNNTGKGAHTPLLNGSPYVFEPEVLGDYLSINAVNSDMLLEIALKKDTSIKKDRMTPCENTPYGFKLSEIMDNIGDISTIPPDKTGGIGISLTNGWNNIAHLSIVQKAFVINESFMKLVKSVFLIKNVGFGNARRVLFKDILPDGVVFKSAYISKNGSSSELNKDINIIGRGVFITLPDINKGESIELTLMLCVNCFTCVGEVNVGCIAYISWQAFNQTTCSASILLTSISNAKMINSCSNLL